MTARLLLWVILALWGLFALTLGAIHWAIVPRIDQARPTLERWASDALGVPVKVGAIQARTDARPSEGMGRFLPALVPSFALSDVRLLDPAGREALRLPQVEVSISVRSLWRLGFERLLIDSPTLDVRRTTDNRIEVAGLDLSAPAQQDSRAANWFFSQTAFEISNGTVRWTDDLRAQPPLALSRLTLNLRNARLGHDFRLDATPPPEWGGPFSLRGRLSEPLIDLTALGAGAGGPPWRNWSGELYADFERADVARLQMHVDLASLGLQVRSGQGAVRAWADVKEGQVTGAVVDLALSQIATRLAPRLPELAIAELHGRLTAQWSATGFEVGSPDLRFLTAEGLDWKGSAIRLQHQHAQGGNAASSTLNAERVNLAALAAIATRLPLPDASRALLLKLKPQGHIEGLKAEWQGVPPVANEAAPPVEAQTAADWQPERYRTTGRLRDFAVAGEPLKPPPGGHILPGRPGIRGAQVDFEFDQDGGKAKLQVENGALDLPGVFEQSELALTRLETDARWRLQGPNIEAWLDNLRLANSDTEGAATAHWSTSDPARSPSKSRFPGVLDLTARLNGAQADRVHRYLPIAIGAEPVRYVREAVRGGAVGTVDFRIKGDLYDMPFNQPGAQGEFRIAAQLKGVDFSYVPPYLQAEDPSSVAWPMVKGATGQLVLDRTSLNITGLESGLEGGPGLRLSNASVGIADLAHNPTLKVSADAQGPAEQVLAFVRGSPVNGFTGQALQHATINGAAQVQFQLQIPLEHIDKTTVSGGVQFPGNDLRISAESPLLLRTVGRVNFTEHGFTVPAAKSQVYGGELRYAGGMAPDAQGVARIRFKGQGSATAEGLRAAGLGLVSRLAEQAAGSAAYSVDLGFRAGVPEINVSTDLQGMAVGLPAPLAKDALQALPLRYENRVLTVSGEPSAETPRTDRLFVQLGNPAQPLATLDYERNLSGAEPRVTRGSVSAGVDVAEMAVMPAEGVQAHIRFRQIDADAWDRSFTQLTGTDPRVVLAGRAPDDSASLLYLPTSVALRAESLLVGGRSYSHVVVGGSREGRQWRANVQADQLNGYFEYRQASEAQAGSVYARLARLVLAPAAAADVEELLQQPNSMPALDIAVDDLVIAERQLGRVEIQAQNLGRAGRAREWRLNKLNLSVPEAQFSAVGNWAFSQSNATGASRRTALDINLDIKDAGALLARFGRAGVVRGGKGVIKGSIGWVGSPMSLDYPTLSGQLNADIRSGQFLKVDPGAAKLLGVLSLQALPRRLALDFRDVFSEGFTFDFVRGDASIAQGVASTNNLQMKGVNAAALMEGSADIAREVQDLKVVVVPEINAGTAALIATVINPAVGLGTFIAQYLLSQPLQSATTQEFHITGQWADPQVDKVERKAPPKAESKLGTPPDGQPATAGSVQ